MITIMSQVLDDLWQERARAQTLADGEALFRAGDEVRSLYRVEGGLVHLMRPLPHGAELVLQRAQAGDVVAEASVFVAAYHCDAVAVGAAQVRGVPLTSVRDAFSRHPNLVLSFSRHLASEVQAARARAEILGLKTVAARVDAWLDLRGGVLPPRGSWRSMAGELGVTPEALYRELAARRGRDPTR